MVLTPFPTRRHTRRLAETVPRPFPRDIIDGLYLVRRTAGGHHAHDEGSAYGFDCHGLRITSTRNNALPDAFVLESVCGIFYYHQFPPLLNKLIVGSLTRPPMSRSLLVGKSKCIPSNRDTHYNYYYK